MRRLVAAVAIALASVVTFAGCVPTPIPIHYDGDTGKSVSKAEWRVAAVTTTKGPGIEVRFRNCSTVRVTSTSPAVDQTAHLRPVARVTDAKGKVLFDNVSPIAAVQPAGSRVVDTKTPATDDLQRIVVPTAGASGAITVDPLCTSYPGYGMGPGYTFDLKPCTTTTRTCATRKAGTGVFEPGG